MILLGWMLACLFQMELVRGDLILSVDFGVADTATDFGSPNDVASGFFDFASPTGPVGNPDFYSTLGPIAKAIGPYSVEVFRPGASNGIIFVDGGNMSSAGTLNDLLEDHVSEFGLGLRIRGLSPGNYSMTSYHHLLGGTAPSTFGVFRSAGALYSQIGTVTTSFGANPAVISQSTLNFAPDADGSVNFRFGDGLIRGYVNGFTLTSVPEPNSLTMILGLGTVLVILKHRRRAAHDN